MGIISSMSTFEMVFFIIIWFSVAWLFGCWARRRGRRSELWFFLFILLGGLISALLLLMLPNLANVNKLKKDELEVLDRVEIKDARLWYYLDKDHVQHGPVGKSLLRDLPGNSYIWSEGMEEWRIMDSLDAFMTPEKH